MRHKRHPSGPLDNPLDDVWTLGRASATPRPPPTGGRVSRVSERSEGGTWQERRFPRGKAQDEQRRPRPTAATRQPPREATARPRPATGRHPRRGSAARLSRGSSRPCAPPPAVISRYG